MRARLSAGDGHGVIGDPGRAWDRDHQCWHEATPMDLDALHQELVSSPDLFIVRPGWCLHALGAGP